MGIVDDLFFGGVPRVARIGQEMGTVTEFGDGTKYFYCHPHPVVTLSLIALLSEIHTTEPGFSGVTRDSGLKYADLITQLRALLPEAAHAAVGEKQNDADRKEQDKS